MATETGIPIIAHAIQLSIAPVFLLTGIAGLLNVMATRLARVMDRARQLEQVWDSLDEPTRREVREEVSNLDRRRHLASWAINFSTCAALLVCVVIVTLFLEEYFSKDFKYVAGALFVGAMIALIGGLFSFLREVYLATHVVRIDLAKFTTREARTPPA
jgi:Protein of unknown function (DUF2721)